MASVPMTASLIPATSLAKMPSSASKRLTVARASASSFEGEKASLELKNESSGRRELLFTAVAVAAAAISVASVGMATEEPKRGTPEAKKKYAQICVTMPTARVCHK